MSAPIIKLQAPAKLILWLKVTGKRDDGYHELDSLLCPVSLYDNLALKLTAPGEGIRLEVGDILEQGIPADGTNLAMQAAARFYARLARAPGVNIALIKRIPAGAGLGGGSSNAAAVLCGLNTLYGNPLTPCQLAELALSIGADVPFFLLGTPAVAQGIGEKLTPAMVADHPAAIIIWPGLQAPTTKIYQNLKLPLTNAPKNSICQCAESNAELKPFDLELQNDLEPAALSLFPEIAAAKNALQNMGLKQVAMSGSGSAVFALCSNLAKAQKLVPKLKIKSGWRIFTVEILNKFGIVL